MHQSHTYAGQGTKSAFVEIAQRRAEIGRLQRGAEGTQMRSLWERLPQERVPSVVSWTSVRYDLLIQRLGKRASELWAAARG
jgi:hypothetical protein